MVAFIVLIAVSALADTPTLDTIVSGVTNAVGVIDKYGLTLDAQAAQRSAVEAIIKIADPSARILTKSDMAHVQDEWQGNDYSLGLLVTMTNGRPRVIEVITNSPAAEAGLQEGDLIDGINGHDTGRTDIVAVSRLLRGHTNDTLHIRFTRQLSPTNEATATLRILRIPAVETAEELPNNLAYIKLNGLYKDSGHDVISIIRGWAEMGRFGAVIDLRSANGDDLDAVTQIASLTATTGDVLYSFRTADGKDTAANKANVGTPIAMPIMILVDERTAGAPEVLAAVLADSAHGAMIIGHETAGDPMIREAIDLPSGDVLYLATRQLVTANGNVYNGRNGIKPIVRVDAKDEADVPDYEPEQTADRRATLDEEIADKTLRERLRGDPALKRSVDILLGLKALNIRGFPITSDTTD